ncbi:MAG: RluA family pseudouridine synthase [Anaerolineae bacterium]|nr:RluA family pseudouridine synthase [Anaerolineae bacterium]
MEATPMQAPEALRRLYRAVTLLYEDDDLLAVSKPAGLSSVHDPALEDETLDLHAWLSARYGRLWPVHRLDRETSGVILFARNAAAHRALNTLFETRAITKVYHAIVVGTPQWDERTINAPLRADADRKHRTIVDLERGKPAITHVRVLMRLRHHALVEAQPETGRTHQIRVHLALVGYPLLADPLYGDGQPLYLSALKHDYRRGEAEERPLIARTALHALRLCFEHPTQGTPLVIEAPYPKDFQAALHQLGKL